MGNLLLPPSESERALILNSLNQRRQTYLVYTEAAGLEASALRVSLDKRRARRAKVIVGGGLLLLGSAFVLSPLVLGLLCITYMAAMQALAVSDPREQKLEKTAKQAQKLADAYERRIRDAVTAQTMMALRQADTDGAEDHLACLPDPQVVEITRLKMDHEALMAPRLGS